MSARGMCVLPLPLFRQVNAGAVARVAETNAMVSIFSKTLSLLAAANFLVENNADQQTFTVQRF